MKKYLNIPNLITIFRIILIPVFLVFYLNESFYFEGFPLFAVLAFLLAFFSDVLDGLIARSKNQITLIGKVLDPLADKLLRLSCLCAFMIKGVLPFYLFVILLVLDVITITVATILFTKKIVIPANIVGKLTTVFMSIALFSCFFHKFIGSVSIILIYIALSLVFITIIQYFVKYIKMFRSISYKK